MISIPQLRSRARAVQRLLLTRLCAAGFVAYCSYGSSGLKPRCCRSSRRSRCWPGADRVRHGGLHPHRHRRETAGGRSVGCVRSTSAPRRWRARVCDGAFHVSGGLHVALALILLRFVHGSATAIFGPVASATLSDIAPPSNRGAWLSTYSAAQGAGQALWGCPGRLTFHRRGPLRSRVWWRLVRFIGSGVAASCSLAGAAR